MASPFLLRRAMARLYNLMADGVFVETQNFASVQKPVSLFAFKPYYLVFIIRFKELPFEVSTFTIYSALAKPLRSMLVAEQFSAAK